WESSSRTRVSRQRGRASEIRVNMFELLLPKHAGIAGTYRPDRAIRLTGSDDSDIFVVRYCDGVFSVVFLKTSLKKDWVGTPLYMATPSRLRRSAAAEVNNSCALAMR